MLNKIILIGRLVKDVEMKYTPSGVAVSTFTLAVERTGSKEKETDFINIVVWRQLAELCAQYLRKGRLAAVDGRLQIRTYDNAEGKRMYITEVVADQVRFLEFGDKPEKIVDPFEGEESNVPVNDDDLPF
jgi:single-strand DNA-binding protein